MKQIYILLFILLCHRLAQAQVTTVNGPSGSNLFGSETTILVNGNYVLVDSNWGNGVATGVGAVYLYKA
ncbi:hypothetical protein DYBT9275_01189 [Dyadobacter sp. CECT 9275]|uniref:Uncharacterized protein n=1 Tax=Dyadobacter helix TaxID=2822344 RepID=A0A916J8H0_9BACT|nr:hypothetical protein [Dyadobacter sp. CECT 9275]CAG4993549.1 hypothetical protein DYBT9275_01189 [Dyadobacter sp. CECT 9275]